MSYNQRLFDSCDEGVRKAYKVLIDDHKKQKIELRNKIDKIKSLPSTDKEANQERARLPELEGELALEFNYYSSDFVYALSKIGSSYVKKYLEASTKAGFFDASTENSTLIYYMYRLGVSGQTIHERIRSTITVEGKLGLNIDEQPGLLRFYIAFNRDSEITKKGLEYWLEN